MKKKKKWKLIYNIISELDLSYTYKSLKIVLRIFIPFWFEYWIGFRRGNNIFKNKKNKEVVRRRNNFLSISRYCYFILLFEEASSPLMFKNISSESLTILERRAFYPLKNTNKQCRVKQTFAMLHRNIEIRDFAYEKTSIILNIT